MNIKNLAGMVINKLEAGKQQEILKLIAEVEQLEAQGFAKQLELTETDLQALFAGTVTLEKLIGDKVEAVKATQSAQQSEPNLEDFIKTLGGGQTQGIGELLNSPLAQLFLGSLVAQQKPQEQQQSPLGGLGAILDVVGSILDAGLKEAAQKQEEPKEETVVKSSTTFMKEDVDLSGGSDEFENVVNEETETVVSPEPTPVVEEETPSVTFPDKVGMKKEKVHSGWNLVFVDPQTKTVHEGLVIAKWVERADVMVQTPSGTWKKRKVRYENMVELKPTTYSNPKPEGSGWAIYNTGTLKLFNRVVPVIFLGEKEGLERVLLLNSTGDKYHLTREEIGQYLK